jgi:hypothetical protein
MTTSKTKPDFEAFNLHLFHWVEMHYSIDRRSIMVLFCCFEFPNVSSASHQYKIQHLWLIDSMSFAHSSDVDVIYCDILTVARYHGACH